MLRLFHPILALILAAFVRAESPADMQGLEAYPKEKVHLFLLAGQSNMAGRGEISSEDKTIHPRIFALSKDGQWVPAVDPIHYDKKSAGVGLGKSFALALAESREDIAIGLIPAACGGSPISTWEPGGYHEQTKSHPFDDAIQRTRQAMANGVLKGVLWHQGEADSKANKASGYEERLKELIQRFRKEFGQADLPFILGQLGQFEANPWDEYKRMVNQAHLSTAEEIPGVRFVDSNGLTAKPDNIHFDSKSLREFGRRYAEAYLTLTARTAPPYEYPLDRGHPGPG